MFSEKDPWEPDGTPEELVGRLSAAMMEIAKPCPFQVGNLVTPKKGRNKKGRGVPNRVVSVYPAKRFLARGDRGDACEIVDIDVLVAFPDGDYRVFAQNSSDYEFWDPEKLCTSRKS